MNWEQFPHGSGMVDRQDLLAMVDVAFCNHMEHREKRSFNKTIDIVVGIYQREGRYKGRLAVCLKPSHGWRDWLVNLCAFGGSHLGYRMEFKKYSSDILQMVMARPEALDKGLIICGRSKGGAEAIMLADELRTLQERILVGAIEPPRAFGKEEAERIKWLFPVLSFSYRNDIVTSLPPWYHTPGWQCQVGGLRTHGLSVQDHVLATTKEELMYKAVDEVCPE